MVRPYKAKVFILQKPLLELSLKRLQLYSKLGGRRLKGNAGVGPLQMMKAMR